MALIIVTVVSVEVFLKMKFENTLKKPVEISISLRKISKRKRVSDHWKEKALKGYSAQLIRFSIELLFKIICVCIPYCILYLMLFVSMPLVIYEVSSVNAFIVSLMSALSWWYLRKLIVS